MENYEFIFDDKPGERLDIYVSRCIPAVSRSLVQKLISDSHITVNSIHQKSNYKLVHGDNVFVNIPPPKSTEIIAEEIPLDVVYEDAEVIVINKASGMTVHPAPGSLTGTLVNAVLAHSDDLSGVGGVERPGIVHRLDKDTSGLLVVAKTDHAHLHLQQQIQSRSAKRKYLAFVWGKTKFNEAEVDAPIGRHPTDRHKMAVIKETDRYTSREARTKLNVIERFNHFTMLEAVLDTGRTHQIRVHLSYIGYPVVGDPVYGGVKRALPASLNKTEQKELTKSLAALHGQALHAYYLSFQHPKTGKQMNFETPLPEEMQNFLDCLKSSPNA